MTHITRQELCAALKCSESTVVRLQAQGLPHIALGKHPRYDLAECTAWLRARHLASHPVATQPPTTTAAQACQPGQTPKAAGTSALWLAAADYTESSRLVRRRVQPSSLKLVCAPT